MIAQVSFVENRIEVGEKWVELEYPIQEAFRDGDRTVVLFYRTQLLVRSRTSSALEGTADGYGKPTSPRMDKRTPTTGSRAVDR